jgi:hypothetical protein
MTGSDCRNFSMGRCRYRRQTVGLLCDFNAALQFSPRSGERSYRVFKTKPNWTAETYFDEGDGMYLSARRCVQLFLCFSLVLSSWANAHEKSRQVFLRKIALAQAEVDSSAERVDRDPQRSCELTIELIDAWTKKPVAGLVRVTNLSSNQPVRLDGEFHRAVNWYALERWAKVRVPRAKLRVEALRGLKTRLAIREVDATTKSQLKVTLNLNEFYETRLREIHGGNTHLHLMNLTHAEADRYLRVVPKADNLDLVFLSHLRRIPDERHYISNQIVENSFVGGDLERLSQDGVLFGNGQEHRHNFGGYDEGFGHVMLLNLQKLIRPISIGPGIMKEGTDGRPLQSNILTARNDGATVIWCHNTFGLEDLPNWASGLVHAQNIFDGGDHGDYADTFYRYLNVGMRVPFSTGTDWFIYDFARVYVPVSGELTVEKWLDGLRDGKSYITNGPFLELETERARIGGTLRMSRPNRVTVVGRGMGRQDFRGLELVYNGKVVHRTRAKSAGGYYVSDLRHQLDVDKPGWFALRIPLDAGKTELDKPLFAHTSPIYITVDDREIFDVPTAKQLVEEMKASRAIINRKARFADQSERSNVLTVHDAGIKLMEARIAAAKAKRTEEGTEAPERTETTPRR